MSKRLLVLNTGGTLGMDPSAEGLAPGAGAAEVFRYIPEALDLADIDTRVLFNLDSANVGIPHWQAIARAIEADIERYDGFVVIHGTDTMAYTAAALSYMLVNLPKPVILTGAQRPIAMIRTDAKSNLVNALELATHDIPEVGLFFDHRLFRGNRAKKVNIEAFDAFQSPNYPSLAEVGLRLEIRHEAIRRPTGLFRVDTAFGSGVLVLRLFPGLRPESLLPLLAGELAVFVFEAYGAGTVPVEYGGLIPFIEEATRLGKLVAICSQAVGGAIDLDLYEGGRRTKAAGAISCGDMTVEAAVVKVMFLLGQFDGDTAKVARHLNTPLAGEMARDGIWER